MILSLLPSTETQDAAGLYPYSPAAPELHTVTENLTIHLTAWIATD